MTWRRFEDRPRQQLDPGPAIAVAVTHPSASATPTIGSAFRSRVSVDTVPSVVTAKEVFDRIGLFDEELLRNQDLELNLRLRRRGGDILLVPGCRDPRPRARFPPQACTALLSVRVLQPPGDVEALRQANIRQVVSPTFILSLLATGILAPWFPWMAALFCAILGSYLAVMIVSSVAVARKRGVACAAACR